MAPLGLSTATSVRVGTQLGARNPAGARRTVTATLCLIACLAVINACLVMSVRSWWGRLFTADPDVVDIVARWLFLLAIYTTLDGFQVRLQPARAT